MRRRDLIPAVPLVLLSLSACGSSHESSTPSATASSTVSPATTVTSAASSSSSRPPVTTTSTVTTSNGPAATSATSSETDSEFAGIPGLTRSCDGGGTTDSRVRIKGAVSCQLAAGVAQQIIPKFNDYDALPGNFTITAYSSKKGADVPYDCERHGTHMVRCERSRYGGASEVWIEG